MKDEKPIRAYRSVQLRARELRKEMTNAEKILWMRLRDHQLSGYKFRRQAPMGHFIADFYCAECKLIVEVDGDIHDLQIEQDKLRTEEMESFGYRVIRFRNEQIEKDIECVLKSILEACRLPSPRIGRRVGDEG
jgi:very-short-patch-repair endonuclease